MLKICIKPFFFTKCIYELSNSFNSQLKTHKELMDVCLLAGNDFTKPFHEAIWNGKSKRFIDVLALYKREFRKDNNEGIPMQNWKSLKGVMVSEQSKKISAQRLLCCCYIA